MMFAMGRSYEDLLVWQKAISFVTEVYRATACFPREEIYGLTGQLRRAAVSVPSNIAEGQSRLSKNEFHHFLSNARGSLSEIETQLIICQNLGYFTRDHVASLIVHTNELGRMLNGLLSSLKQSTD